MDDSFDNDVDYDEFCKFSEIDVTDAVEDAKYIISLLPYNTIS